jgi:hypothetical protein
VQRRATQRAVGRSTGHRHPSYSSLVPGRGVWWSGVAPRGIERFGLHVCAHVSVTSAARVSGQRWVLCLCLPVPGIPFPADLSLSLPSYPWRLEQTNFPFSSSNPLQLQHCAVLCHAQCLLTVPRSMFLLSTLGMFAWLMSHQQTVFYSQNKSATNSQQYFSLKTNQHQLSATSQTNR